MRIAYHLGAHFTDEERLLKCLLKNRDTLASANIVVPGPKRYRTLLRETAIALKGQPSSPETQSLLLDQIMDEDEADRLILSWDSFLSLPNYVLKRTIYPTAGERVRAFSQIFPESSSEFFLGIRNPAAVLPALYERRRPVPTYAEFLGGADPYDLRWSDVIERILDSNPDTPLTIWCDEDTPLIWPEVLRAVTGLADSVVFEGEDDLLETLMSGEGIARLRAYLAGRPRLGTAQRRKVVSAFLDKFALQERLHTEMEMPGWTDDVVAELTELYDEDVARIARMGDITFLAA